MRRITFVAATFVLCWAMSSRALYAQNAVTDWATNVQDAITAITPPKLPATQLVLRAMVQIAVYDAVVAIQGGYQPFAGAITAPRDADVGAAVATAAYLTARSRLGDSLLDGRYAAYMNSILGGAAKDEGVTVAAPVIQLRSGDGLDSLVPYACSPDRPAGEFEPNGGCGTQPLGTDIGHVRPFTFRP